MEIILYIVCLSSLAIDVINVSPFTLALSAWSSLSCQVFPLPLLFVVGLVSGLGGTKRIRLACLNHKSLVKSIINTTPELIRSHCSLPMFAVLRRFNIAMTMWGEYYILGYVTHMSCRDASIVFFVLLSRLIYRGFGCALI